MKAVGLVTEYNPFHNGHLHHLNMAKQVSGADVVVAVMSGNFTQRGEAAILDKWTRANEALVSGVDLVIELPIFYAVQPAHLFAQGALTLLNQLQISELVFGSEHPEIDFNQLVQAEEQFDSEEFSQYNGTYATRFNQQLKQQTGIELTEPNDILAYCYHKAVQQMNSSIKLTAIERVSNSYHDQRISSQIASASAIRHAVFNQLDYRESVPEQTAIDLFQSKAVVDWNMCYPYLRYLINQASIDFLQGIYQMSEGLEHKFKEIAENAATFDEFMSQIKSKRYTYSRLSRLCLYTLLQITDTEMKQAAQLPYLRVLGFNERGQEYLHSVKKDLTIPLVTKVDRDLKQVALNLDYRAGKFIEQMTGVAQDLKKSPIIMK
ncbi:nucleotidyltransferase [Paucilactobacillus nenjiangensis]|uniref:nucleotidyltransferase n=1 Tax=Paucilactobacillus nenjiangensis TaxID=1296540 RepID=UPI003BAE867B